MYLKFKEHISNNFPFLLEGRSVVAISGGIDSVVLTYLCKDAGLDFALAHCNFNLRGEESDQDEKFVTSLANKLHLEVFIQNFDTQGYAKANKLSSQMAARQLRYNWFDDLCKQMNFDYLLTAHHADDNLETFLINLCRGAGLEGLTGIPEINGNVIRPLLSFSRNEIEEFAVEAKISWREDSSNESTKYVRNKLRHEVIPVLKEINSQLLNSFATTTSYLNEAEEIIEDRLDDISEKVLEVSNNAIYLNIKELKNLSNPKAYLYFLLKNYGFTQWNDIYNLLDSQSGAQVFSKEWRLIKDRSQLILTKIIAQDHQEISISKGVKSIRLYNGSLEIKEVAIDDGLIMNSNIIYVDKNKLSFPLTLRKWQKGDWFHPFGMTGKKKVAKYFKDEKFSLIDKENTWLLCSGENIVWIVNHRADNRFGVTKATSSVLQITFK